MKAIPVLIGVLAIGGCGGVQERGNRLARELPAAFPEQISAVSFENAPPLAAPTLVIQTRP
jgi:hypothetical protein